MNSGEIEEGAMVLRAKIDMANPNMHFRDPIIYRVVKHPHLMDLLNNKMQEIPGVVATETLISLEQSIKKEIPIRIEK